MHLHIVSRENSKNTEHQEPLSCPLPKSPPRLLPPFGLWLSTMCSFLPPRLRRSLGYSGRLSSKGEPSPQKAQAYSESVLPGSLQQLDHFHRGTQLCDGGQCVWDVLTVLVAIAVELGEIQGRSLGHRVEVGMERDWTIRCSALCP